MYPQDAVLLVIDPQKARLEALGETVRSDIVNNLHGIAKLARLYGLPVMVTTDAGAGAVPPELSQSCGQSYRHERANASVIDETLFSRLKDLKRGHLIIAGLVGKASLADAALAALWNGYRVHVATDSVTECHDKLGREGILRMTGAGVRLTSWVSLVAEFAGTTGSLPEGFDTLRAHLDNYMFAEQPGAAPDFASTEDAPVLRLVHVA